MGTDNQIYLDDSSALDSISAVIQEKDTAMIAEMYSLTAMEEFTALMDKAYQKFAKLRSLAHSSRGSREAFYNKAFQAYARLWKYQQENRQKLLELGLKRWEVGEIASRIGQLYYNYYLHTSQLTFLLESYIFYEAIAAREYFKENIHTDPGLANKQLRYVTRFIVVSLLLNRRDMARKLLRQLRSLVEEYSTTFQAADSREWKLIVNEGIRFMKADSVTEGSRTLRYSIHLDAAPGSLPPVASLTRDSPLTIQDAMLTSYYQNEVKFGELTLDTFRMLQALEWEPSNNVRKSKPAQSHSNLGVPSDLSSVRNGATELDEILLPNPHKHILYRPTVPQLLLNLSAAVDELSHEGALLLYISAAGITPTFQPHELHRKSQVEEGGIVIGSRGEVQNGYGDGDIILHPDDFLPFTRRPLYFIVDSNNSSSFELISGRERGCSAVFLMSPAVQPPEAKVSAGGRNASTFSGSFFTLFLTAPLLAFCRLVNVSLRTIHSTVYHSAEKQLSIALSTWGSSLASSPDLDPAWARYMGDPMARIFLLRFVFCRAVLGLHSNFRYDSSFLPKCCPSLPPEMLPTSGEVCGIIQQLASLLGVSEQFQEDPDMYSYSDAAIHPVQSDPSQGSASPLSDLQNSRRRAVDGGNFDSEEQRVSFDPEVTYNEVDAFDSTREFQGGFALTPAHELQFPRGQQSADEGRSGSFKEASSTLDPQNSRKFRKAYIRNSITASPLILPTRVMRQRTKWSDQGLISTLPEDAVLDGSGNFHDELEAIQEGDQAAKTEGRRFMAKTRGVIMRMLKLRKSKKNDADHAPSIDVWQERDYDSEGEEGGQAYEHQDSQEGSMETEKKGWWRKNRKTSQKWSSVEEYEVQGRDSMKGYHHQPHYSVEKWS